MSVTRIRTAVQTALSDNRITGPEAQKLIDAAKADTGFSEADKVELRGALSAFDGKFDPDARIAIQKALGLNAVTSGPAAPGPRQVTFIYDAGDKPLTNLQLNGSWDRGNGAFMERWPSTGIPMKPLGDGRWAATVSILDDGQKHDWQWGVTADGPSGKGQWAVMGEDNLKFAPTEGAQIDYAPTTFHKMGVHREGTNDIRWAVTAPNAKNVAVKVTKDDGTVQMVPMIKDNKNVWSAQLPDQFDALAGSQYVYSITDSKGNTVEKADPYARVMMGEQRGLSRSYFDSSSGAEVNPFASNKTDFMRFEIGNEASYDRAYVVLKKPDGTPMTKAEVLSTIGPLDPTLAQNIQKSRGVNDLGALTIEDDGRIRMQNEGGTWTAFLQNPDKLDGLRYELQIWSKDASGKLFLHDDKNRDNIFTDAERKASPNNDHFSDVITKDSGMTFRGSVIADTAFNWQNDAAPREKDPRKWVVYQMHVGSFFGTQMNSNRSTFDDILKRLDYLKGLGINTIEMLPVNEVEGNRDWGYMGANSLAIESAYGFEDSSGKWVTGTQALKVLIDEAHKRGLNVMNDVVYNHVGGNNNFLWNFDGPENEYFNWGDPSNPQLKNTPWGSMPAFDKPEVKQFYVDHAMAQLDELHFDGMRFDFTGPIKGDGGKAGADLLREINRQAHFFHPGTFTVAEQFDYDPWITRPAGPNEQGGGMDAQWYTEWQHRMVNDGTPFRPGIVQAAAHNWRTNMDDFMSMMTSPYGLESWRNALTIISNHDEVGNAQRTITVANANTPSNDPAQFARNAARFAAGIGLAAPGTPIFFQGEESQARNEFKWGNPSTWDMGWSWENLGNNWDWNQLTFNDDQRKVYDRLTQLPASQRQADPAYRALSGADKQVVDDLSGLSPADRQQAFIDIPRRQSVQFFREAIGLRHSSEAFDADASVKRIYTHNDNSVMAFERQKGNDDFIVVGSLNHQPFKGYGLDLPQGRWQEVFNSDASRFGGTNFGNGGATVNGGSASLNIPSAGYIVLKKVG
jgi:maltooligosyltrehalose trehalohydrolase